VSYRHLGPARRQFFDLLGLHPGITIDSYAAAALAGVGPDEAGRLLDSLHGEGLLWGRPQTWSRPWPSTATSATRRC
jgi:hypothetical protein